MRYILIILFLLRFGVGYSQKENVSYDPAVPEYIKYLWAGEKTHFRERLYASTDPAVAQITAFFKEIIKKENNILSESFLKKPSDNTLVAYYLHVKLLWNSGDGPARPKDDVVVAKALRDLPNRYTLLLLPGNFRRCIK